MRFRSPCLRALVVGSTLGLGLLAGCSSGESDVMGKSPPTTKTLIPRGDTSIGSPGGGATGQTDLGAGSTTTGGRH